MLVDHLAGGHRVGLDVQQFDMTLHGALDVPRLGRAWQLVAAQHPVLRTRFRWEGLDSPRQEVLDSVDVDLTRHDLSASAAADGTAEVEQFLDADRLRGVALDLAPLWRIAVFGLTGSRHRLVWTYSHALLDESAFEMLGEVFDAYRALEDGTPPRFRERVGYREYIAWLQKDWAVRAPAARAFWREHLNGVVKPTTLEALQQTPGSASPAAAHATLGFRLSGATVRGLRRLCRRHDLHASAFVHAAWALALGSFTGTDDVVFGEVRSCRSASGPAAADIVGLVSNIVPVRARLPADRPVLELLRELHEARIAVRAFEQTPLAEAIASSAIPRGARAFDTVVSVRDEAATGFEASGLVIERIVRHGRPNFSFTVGMVMPRGTVALSFDRARFDAGLATRIATLIRRLIHAMVTRPGATLSELPRLPAADQRAMAAFNRTSVEVRPPGCVHEAVEAQVDRTPDAVAVICGERALTYRELDRRANDVAAELVGHGIGPERTVGVFVQRSLEMLVGVFGILKTGGAYVPLDPTYPSERLGMMLEDAGPRVVLTTDRLRAAIPPSAARVVSLDAVPRHAERVGVSVSPDHLAYVMFTSGSTGRPKGVQVEHRSIVNCFRGIDDVLGPTPGVWLAMTGIAFDISVLELFWTLARGFTVVIHEESRPPADEGSPTLRTTRTLFDFDLRSQVRRHGVTHLQCTPSLLSRFVTEDGGLEAVGALRHLLVGGEALPAQLVDQLAPHLTGTLHNMYGPTEATIWCTAATVTPGGPITIGRPLANTTVHICDHALRPVPIGVPGEVLVGGAGVARGYVGRPELTAERFVRDAVTGERLYRTGDLAKWCPDGRLLFLGRMDHQVKIRGVRVELEEIDSVLSAHPAVHESVTLAHDSSGDLRLIAYVVPEPAAAVGLVDQLAVILRNYARSRLPASMIPAAVVPVGAMPLTLTGKVDRKALAARYSTRPPASDSQPEGPRAGTIIAVLQDLIGRDVGADDNFFDVGADSLLLLQASSRLGARLGRAVTLEEMLRHPTARALAAALADADATASSRDRARQRQEALRRRAERESR
jgi:amino acid adenylation domain-containing protein